MGRLRVGNVVIEPDRNRVNTNGHVRRVGSREMDVLTYLVGNAGRVVSREELLNHVWSDVVVNDEALTLVVSRLRTAMGDNPRDPQYIETIPKKGYRLMVRPERVLNTNGTHAGELPRPSRASWIWLAVVTTLLIAMTALYLIVRVEYERVGSSQETPADTRGHSDVG